MLSGLVIIGDSGGMSSADVLNVSIKVPTEDYNLEQPFQLITWNVSYNNTGTYTQLVEFAPWGTDEYRPIASGFVGDHSSSFDTVWDLSQAAIDKGKYTIRVTATDGMFIASGIRNVTISYLSGKISIDSPDTKVIY